MSENICVDCKERDGEFRCADCPNMMCSECANECVGCCTNKVCTHCWKTVNATVHPRCQIHLNKHY